MLAFLFAAAMLGAPPASAVEDSAVARTEWTALGWDDACSVALELKIYPKLDTGLHGDPVETRVGTLTIPSGAEDAKQNWTLELDGAFSWDERLAAKAEKDLNDAGYTRAGYPETVRTEVAARPGLAEVLLSTAALDARVKNGWPGPSWRLAGADFNALSTCALLVYAPRSGGPLRKFKLARVYSPRARVNRALAHAQNARLLFQAGDIDSAAAEAATGAALAPELAVTRYEDAAFLTLTGQIVQAVAELTAALRLDPTLRAKARDDADFEALRARDDFQRLVGP
ncbi:MAG: hypothetical protein HKL90_09365 [Elusimicrobia bacterium]|nr:hypothetical protein [Elusimicrobiota bacterium]